MRPLFLALLLGCVAFGAQSAELSPIHHEGGTNQEMIDADRRFVEEAVTAAGSREEAAKAMETRGWQHLKRGEAATAIKRFNQAAALNPLSSEAYWGLGAATSQNGQFDASSHLFERAFTLDPHNAPLLADIGLAYTRQATASSPDSSERAQGLANALTWLDKAEKIDPSYALTYANRAIALAYLGDYNKAWANVERAEKLDKASVDPQLITYLSARQARPEPAAMTRVMNAVQVDAANGQPASDKEIPVAAQPSTLPAAALPAVAEPEATTVQATFVPAQPVVQQLAPSEVQPEAAVAPQAESEPAPEKTLRVVSGKPSAYQGADKRHCLDLPTNEAIMQCVYPRR